MSKKKIRIFLEICIPNSGRNHFHLPNVLDDCQWNQ